MPLTVCLVLMEFSPMGLAAVDWMGARLAATQRNHIKQSATHSAQLSPHAVTALPSVHRATQTLYALDALRTFTCTVRVASTIAHQGWRQSSSSENVYSANIHALSAKERLPTAPNAANCL
jgi:hypothetical protein